MVETIMEDLRSVWMEFGAVNIYLIAGITFLFLLIQTILFASNKGIFSKKNAIKILLWFMIGAVYFCFVLDLTLLNRETGTRYDVSLQIFGTFHQDADSMRFVIENILLFFPLGIWLPNMFLRFRRWWLCGITGLLLSLMIEITQWILKRGFFQVDDIWLNTLGTLVGYLIAWLLSRLFRKVKDNNDDVRERTDMPKSEEK